MEKRCSKCGQVKTIENFYKQKAMKDGHLGSCIECTKAYGREYRAKNLELLRARDRARGLLPERKERVRGNAKKYNDKNRGRAAMYPDKQRARWTVANGIARGKINREPCVRCGATERVHAHHEDHSKPLDIVWLCSDHHGERHREINAARRHIAGLL